MIVVFRLFLGWSHVGQRLSSETVEYEESGWYDGQIWTKTQDILYRDRLASGFTVKPALDRLKTTLLTVSGSFVTCLLLLSVIEPSHPPPPTRDGTAFAFWVVLMESAQGFIRERRRSRPMTIGRE